MKNRLADGEVRRQAIVVLSDGEDTSSLVGFDDVLELAKQSGVAVYTITLRSALSTNLFVRDRAAVARSEFSMKALAQETGARSFFPAAITELAGVYSSIAKELASQPPSRIRRRTPKKDGSVPPHQRPRGAARRCRAVASRVSRRSSIRNRRPLK